MKTIHSSFHGRTIKMGRKRPVAVGPHFRLRNYLLAALPSAPANTDYSSPAKAVLADVMLNDQLGDCVIAGGYHVTAVETGNASGTPFHATQAQIVKDYSAIGGYVPGDEGTDQGCDEPTALNYWTQHGFANGTKLLGWLALDATNKQELMQACYLFENLYFGIELPDAWVNPFPSGNGFVWDVGKPDPENGHCVIGYGYNSRGVLIDSWGLDGVLTWEAIAALCTQQAGGAVYVLLSPDQLMKGAAKAPNGVAWNDLISDFDSMGGHVPVPAPPTPPAPTPTPTPVPTPTSGPTLSQAQTAVKHALDQQYSVLTRTRAESTALRALAGLPGWPT